MASVAPWGPERAEVVPPVGHTWSTYLLGAGSHVVVGSSDPCSHGALMVSACSEQIHARDCSGWEAGVGETCTGLGSRMASLRIQL